LRISTLPFFVLALPFLEIAGFVIVGKQIGALATVGLVLASTIAGSLLLRHQGFGVMRRVRAEVAAKRDPSRQLAHGAMIVLAAVLLIIPGFLTDIVALLLLLPPVRDFAWRALKSRVVVAGNFGMGGFGGGFRGHERGKVIDLDDDDFSHDGGKADPESPWRRLKDD
jgi:UPF0716 protein FxsA